ncbi:heavy metal translocating P-type ATPase [Rubinisphaera italica]|uniref:Copper-exporting P-type ATPase A n=1 Tax=Rubinisphaera italica TaxID=2527969 RepID=A0A5C5XAQ2_9PLAN|nr:heavy metal translocating P-type ATPase [Rubinisphaera italica]TWT60060.1 Copper-exporting P-type ATPase A [Rubinisphaera italica]
MLSESISTDLEQKKQHCSCAHCGLPVPASMYHPENTRMFCCHGCETAYLILQDDDELRNTLQERQQHSNRDLDYTSMDHDAFKTRYVRSLSPERRQIRLLLEGIYCSSCVFAIEKLSQYLDGVISSRVNLTNSTVTIEWDPEIVSLSVIAQTLHRLGYSPHPVDDDRFAEIGRKENRKRLINLAVAGACAGNAMMIAFALYSGVFSGMATEHLHLFRWTSLIVATVSLFGPGSLFFQSAWRAMQTRTSHMDVPVAVGLLAGYGLGLANTVLGRGEIYFDSISVLVFLLLIGRYLQFWQQRKAVHQISLLKALTPQYARRINKENLGQQITESIPLDAIEIGDELEVRAGDLIPVDGLIRSGKSSVDCSILTGESIGVPVIAGDHVSAGTMNISSPLVIQAECLVAHSRLSEIASLVEAGIQSKTPIVQFANAIGGYFVSIVLLLAGLTFLGWAAFSLELAINHAMTLLIVACPCALGLATPFTIAIAQARAARQQILVKSGDVFEQLQNRGTVWLDKTGTITEGKISVVEYQGEAELIPIIFAIEKNVVHPIATALVRDLASKKEFSLTDRIEDVNSLPGYGVCGQINGATIAVGSEKLIEKMTLSISEDLNVRLNQFHQSGLTGIVIAVDGTVKAICAISDQIRPDASIAIEQLKSAGWKVGILSGDHTEVVNLVGSQLGIPAGMTFSQISPEQKLEIIQNSSRQETTIMVGDGVNDSASLAAASMGIAVHGGAAVSLQAADVYINRPGLLGITVLMQGAKKTVRTIRFNFAVSLSYNIIAAGLAMSGMINPIIAAILMPLSSLSVLTIAFLNPAFRENQS